MKILLIDTARENLTVFLFDGEKTFSVVDDTRKNGHSETLLTAIDKVLSESGNTLDDMDYFCTNVGPGSFTGIRIGVCTANAFAYVTGKKIIPLTTFMPFEKGETAVALDAKHGNCYFEKFVGGKREYGFSETAKLQSEGEVIFVEGNASPESYRSAALALISEAKTSVAPFYAKESEAEIKKNV